MKEILKMRKTMSFAGLLLIALSGCTPAQAPPATVPVETGTSPASLPNPASVYCEQEGNRVEIRTASDGSQTGYCIFPDESECDEWAYYRGGCGWISTPAVATATSTPNNAPTSPPILPTEYQGWWTYTDPVYSFSIMLPEDWEVQQVTTGDGLMNGHMLNLRDRRGQENIRMTFRRMGEDALLWPTGVGEGQFIEQGTLTVAGKPATRLLLVCPSGDVTAIWYHDAEDGQPNIQRNDLEFAFIFSGPGHCEPGYSLDGKTQRLGEMIIASLTVP
jgi:putative hemolysin